MTRPTLNHVFAVDKYMISVSALGPARGMGPTSRTLWCLWRRADYPPLHAEAEVAARNSTLDVATTIMSISRSSSC